MKKIDIVENMINDHFQNDATNLYHFERLHFQTIENDIDAMDYDFFDKNIVQYMAAKFADYETKGEKMNKKIAYTALLDIYTNFKTNGLNVLSFNSDTNCILISKITTAEIMAVSATLKATGFNNEIIVIESLMFRIRFI